MVVASCPWTVVSGVSIRGLGCDDLIQSHICYGFEVEKKGNWNASRLIESDHILLLHLPPREREGKEGRSRVRGEEVGREEKGHGEPGLGQACGVAHLQNRRRRG